MIFGIRVCIGYPHKSHRVPTLPNISRSSFMKISSREIRFGSVHPSIIARAHLVAIKCGRMLPCRKESEMILAITVYVPLCSSEKRKNI